MKKKFTTYFRLILLILLFLAINFSNLFILAKPDTKNQDNKSAQLSIKLDWNQTIANNGEDIGFDMTIGINNGIYVAGKTYNSSKNADDIILVKYNESGNLLWNKIWGCNTDDIAYSINKDSSDNIYVAGTTTCNQNKSFDIVLLKYNNLGDLLWNVTWGGSKWDVGYGLALDNSNNIFVIGYTESYSSYGDVVFLKYNDLGELDWNKTWGGSDTDLAYDIALDSFGNIYITGYTSSFGAITSDLFVVKFNINGEVQWNVTWGGDLPDNGYSLVIDSSNNIFVVGNTQNYGAGGNDIVLFKFNSFGDPLWNTIWGGSEHDYGYSIALDSKDFFFLFLN